jgi:hypothetical protein
VTRALVVAALLAVAAPARAFHTGSTFDAAPGAGGGGGLFYTGSPRERGWTCSACHVDPPGRLRVSVSSSPASLLSARTYEPGADYRITVKIARELRGLASTRSNFNSMAVTVLDREGSVDAGSLTGFDSSRFHARGSTILASDSTQPGETEWAFTWRAPAAGRGTITMWLGVVDGDGAGSPATSTLTDPFGDDVAMGAFALVESTTWALAPESDRAVCRSSLEISVGCDPGSCPFNVPGSCPFKVPELQLDGRHGARRARQRGRRHVDGLRCEPLPRARQRHPRVEQHRARRDRVGVHVARACGGSRHDHDVARRHGR